MSFFSRLFGNDDPVNSRLVKEYAIAFQSEGQSASEALTMARDMLAKAKAEVVTRGWSNQPANYGDVLLQKESTNPNIAAGLQSLRKEGVRDEDVRWWWNLPAVERVMSEQADELNRMAPFLMGLQQGKNPADVAKEVFKAQPKFGNPDDETGDDRPIPIELKRRIVEWSERQSMNPGKFTRMMDAASSLNALIRAEIQAGNL